MTKYIFAFLASLLTISGCRALASLPPEEKDAAMYWVNEAYKHGRNITIESTGAGKVPEEVIFGWKINTTAWEELFCLHIKLEAGTLEFKPNGAQYWEIGGVHHSSVVYRISNKWKLLSRLNRNTWDKLSCPGEYLETWEEFPGVYVKRVHQG